MVPLITQAQNDLLTSVSLALAAGVSMTAFNTEANSFINGTNHDRLTSGTWQWYLSTAWTEGQSQSPVASSTDFLNCISDFNVQITGGMSLDSVRARGRSGAF